MESRLNYFLHLLFLLALTIGHVSASPNKSIFILAGQSNMVGRRVGYDSKGKKLWDKLNILHQHACLAIRFNSEYSWEVAMEPLHGSIDKANLCRVGLGMLFAHELLKRALSLGVIGLVPCAIGDTYITLWLPGTTYDNQTLKRAFAALKEGGKLRALLWYHGENEAKDGVGSFAVDVPKIFTSIRKDLNLPHLPIVQVALPPDGKGVFRKDVRNLQLHFNLPPMKIVDAKG
nr:probable carbohydrate esterase At4g34215 [Ipomoea trifida]